MSKDPGFGASFKGRFWSCSQKLSQLRSVRINLNDVGLKELGTVIDTVSRGYQDIYFFSKSDGEPRFLGAIYFLKRSFSELMSVPILKQIYTHIKDFYTRPDIPDLPTFGYANNQLFQFNHLNAAHYAN